MGTDVATLRERWPLFEAELRTAVLASESPHLAAQLGELPVAELCGCAERDCQTFYAVPKPDGPWGAGFRNLVLLPPWDGYLVLDLVDERIVLVEVLGRAPLA